MIVSAMTCFGQSLFFDTINNSTWTSEAYYNDSTIRTSKKIGLGKLKHSGKFLEVNATLWIFKDELLTIKYYNFHLKKDSLVATYKYEVDADKGILRIILNDNRILEYGVGIVATGSYALLIRKKEKKRK